jgi:hypothetical protein
MSLTTSDLLEYTRLMADHMGLRDWTITISVEGTVQDDHAAECLVTYGQKTAEISFREDWVNWPDEQLRWIVCHELIHCHLWVMMEYPESLSDYVGSVAFSIWDHGFQQEMEQAVNGMARPWAELLPLIQRKQRKVRVKPSKQENT